MNRNASLQKQSNNFSKSINKRNYSANILGKTVNKRFNKNTVLQNNNIGIYKENNNNNMNVIMENDNYNNIVNHHKQNNLEKFLFLNQQLKDNDIKKKNNIGNFRNITSAEPNILKTKLSQKIGKILNNNEYKAVNPQSATIKKNSNIINNMNYNNLINNNKKFNNFSNNINNLYNNSINHQYNNIIPNNFNPNYNNSINPKNNTINKSKINNNLNLNNQYYNINNQMNNNYNNTNNLNKNNLLNNNKILPKPQLNYNNGHYNNNINHIINNNIQNNNNRSINSNNQKNPNSINLIVKENNYNKDFNRINKQNNPKPYEEFFVKLVQNTRENMEDFHLTVDNFNNKESQALFGVFDGHGGIDISKKLKDDISGRFAKLCNQNSSGGSTNDSNFIENNIKTLFKKLDEEIIKQYTINTQFETTNFKSLGSTCSLLYFLKENNKETYLYSANVGDTKALLISKNGYTRITYDHKPSDDFENKRIKSNGGVIFSGRIFGQFGLTRAFGNIPLKKWVIVEPFIKKSVISENDKFAVVAYDGIWDVITDEECFEFSMKYNNSKTFCEDLVNTALTRWSKDNISCIVIKL